MNNLKNITDSGYKYLQNVKDTLMYYYVNPNVNYIKTSSIKQYNDSKNDFAKINFGNLIEKPNEFKIKNRSYDILTPHKIKLSSNINYENKLKIGFIVCFLVAFLFFVKYIEHK